MIRIQVLTWQVTDIQIILLSCHLWSHKQNCKIEARKSEPVPSLLPQALDGVDQACIMEENTWKPLENHCKFLLCIAQCLIDKIWEGKDAQRKEITFQTPTSSRNRDQDNTYSFHPLCKLTVLLSLLLRLLMEHGYTASERQEVSIIHSKQHQATDRALRSSRNSWVGVVTINLVTASGKGSTKPIRQCPLFFRN